MSNKIGVGFNCTRVLNVQKQDWKKVYSFASRLIRSPWKRRNKNFLKEHLWGCSTVEAVSIMRKDCV